MTDNAAPATTDNPSNSSYDSEVFDKPKFAFPARTNESSTHSGNCHCGAIRFHFTLSPPLHSYPVICCNCSICARNGFLLVYPDRADFVLERPSADGPDEGEPGFEGCFDKDGEVVGGYTFGDAKVKHRFCKRCGSSVFASFVPGKWERFFDMEDARELVPINVRMITGLDLDALKLRKVDGWNMITPQYKLKD